MATQERSIVAPCDQPQPGSRAIRPSGHPALWRSSALLILVGEA
jgi:hypothetical protein